MCREMPRRGWKQMIPSVWRYEYYGTLPIAVKEEDIIANIKPMTGKQKRALKRAVDKT